MSGDDRARFPADGSPVLTVVGSGTLLPDGERSSAAHFVRRAGLRILLDCGSGAVHGMGGLGLPWAELTHVVISHFHVDHVGDLPALLFALRHGADRAEPLRIVGPVGTRTLVRRLRDAHGDFVEDPGFPVKIREVESGDVVDAADGVRLRFASTVHTGESLACRVEAAGGTLGYTGDAGYSDELASFMHGVDVLLSECALADPPEIETHLSPAGVARMATVARPGLVVLTHVYPPVEPDEVADLVRDAGWDGPARMAEDGATVVVGASGRA